MHIRPHSLVKPTALDEISDETCTTRLFAYDLAEVKSMCVDGKTKSDVIREMVRRALYARSVPEKWAVSLL